MDEAAADGSMTFCDCKPGAKRDPLPVVADVNWQTAAFGKFGALKLGAGRAGYAWVFA